MKVKMFFMSLFILLLAQQRAEAYLDPGTGSMIVQSIIASVAAIGCVLITIKDRFFSFFKKDKKDKDSAK